MTSPITYDDIKTLAVKLRRPTSTLIALAPGNDPSYCAPARQALARWFADEVWPLLDPDADSVHVRRLHYLVVNQLSDYEFGQFCISICVILKPKEIDMAKGQQRSNREAKKPKKKKIKVIAAAPSQKGAGWQPTFAEGKRK